MSAIPAPVFAGFWRRFAAWLVDFVILYFAAILILLAVAVARVPETAYAVAIVLLAVLYHAGFHSSARQATPGKNLVGIKVTDASGRRIGFGRAVLRCFAAALSALPLLLGFALSAFTARKRALHDILAGTLVVSDAATAEQVMGEASGTMPLTAGVWAVIVIPIASAILLGMIAIHGFRDYMARAKSAGAAAAAAAKASQGK